MNPVSVIISCQKNYANYVEKICGGVPRDHLVTRKELSHNNENGLPGQKRPDSAALRGSGGLYSIVTGLGNPSLPVILAALRRECREINRNKKPKSNGFGRGIRTFFCREGHFHCYALAVSAALPRKNLMPRLLPHLVPVACCMGESPDGSPYF